MKVTLEMGELGRRSSATEGENSAHLFGMIPGFSSELAVSNATENVTMGGNIGGFTGSLELSQERENALSLDSFIPGFSGSMTGAAIDALSLNSNISGFSGSPDIKNTDLANFNSQIPGFSGSLALSGSDNSLSLDSSIPGFSGSVAATNTDTVNLNASIPGFSGVPLILVTDLISLNASVPGFSGGPVLSLPAVANDTLITDGLLSFYRFDNGSNLAGSGQTVTNYGSNTQTLQLGSTTGSDTSDPSWGNNAGPYHNFFGDDYDLLTGGITGLSFATANHTQIFLGKWDTVGTAISQKFPFIAHASAGDRAGTMQLGGTAYLDSRIGNATLQSATGIVAAGEWLVYHALRNGTYGEHGKNTTVLNTSNSVANGTQGTNYRVGAAGNTGQFLTGSIAAYLVYNRALTSAELLQTYRYLRNNIATPRSITLAQL